jgi:glucose-6-phosphate isomerase
MIKFVPSVRRRPPWAARETFKLVVNIGIDGSELGVAMGVQALSAFTDGALRCGQAATLNLR